MSLSIVPLCIACLLSATSPAAEKASSHELDGQAYEVHFTMGDEVCDETLYFDGGNCSSMVIEKLQRHKVPYGASKSAGKLSVSVSAKDGSEDGPTMTYSMIIEGDTVSGNVSMKNEGIDLMEPAKLTGKRKAGTFAIAEPEYWKFSVDGKGSDTVLPAIASRSRSRTRP
jgi:hypothetical protein